MELQERLANARVEQGSLAEFLQQPPPGPQAWKELTADELRTQCRLRGLPHAGLKAVLIDRIIEATGPELEILHPDDSQGIAAAASDPAEDSADAAQDVESLAAAPAVDGKPAEEPPPTGANDLSSYKYSTCIA